MRLLNARSLKLESFQDDRSAPRYAILSHTWGDGEVLYEDIKDVEVAKSQAAYHKIEYTCRQALRDNLEYVWIDTCCIDKSSSAELSEAINSMFRWYQRSAICYAYLSDVKVSEELEDRPVRNPQYWSKIHSGKHWEQPFKECRWFKRGWTLQELVAPKTVKFFGSEWKPIGLLENLSSPVAQVTGIDRAILRGELSIFQQSIARRMSWAANRSTTRVEDIAYSLIGIFDINMPLLYGEGERAFTRLQQEVFRNTTDDSLLAWGNFNVDTFRRPGSRIFASSPEEFIYGNNIVRTTVDGNDNTNETTNEGIRIQRLVQYDWTRRLALAVLNCRIEDDLFNVIALRCIIPDSVKGKGDITETTSAALEGAVICCSSQIRLMRVPVRVLMAGGYTKTPIPLRITAAPVSKSRNQPFWVRKQIPEAPKKKFLRKPLTFELKFEDARPLDWWRLNTGMMLAPTERTSSGSVIIGISSGEAYVQVVLLIGCLTRFSPWQKSYRTDCGLYELLPFDGPGWEEVKRRTEFGERYNSPRSGVQKSTELHTSLGLLLAASKQERHMSEDVCVIDLSLWKTMPRRNQCSLSLRVGSTNKWDRKGCSNRSKIRCTS